MPDTTTEERDYLSRLFRDASPVNLSGIDRNAAGEEMAACVDLWEVYTALFTESGGDGLLDKRKRGDLDRRFEPVVNVLNAQKRLILVGDAGSGKSTFVNFLVLCLTGDRLNSLCANLKTLKSAMPDDDGKPGERQQWSHGALLPIRVILRDLAASRLLPEQQRGKSTHLLKFLEAELKAADISASLPFIKQQLDKGAILLFDGFDEVAGEARQQQICDVVNECVTRYDKCRILVTSRPSHEANLKLEGFAKAAISPFTDRQIRWFVERWYKYVEKIKRRDAERAHEWAASLNAAIFDDPRLEHLARRPLLLTLIAALHEYKSGQLPRKPAELYYEATDLLLSRWECAKFGVDAAGNRIPKESSLSDMLKITKDRLLNVLQHLAFDAHATQQGGASGTADIPEMALLQALHQVSRAKRDINDNKLIEYLRDRAGLLLPRGEHYTFPHRTFQEYLAACHLTNDQNEFPENIAGLARSEPNRWREVVFFAGAKTAQGSPSNIWPLAEALCYRPTQDAQVEIADAYGALLAAQALSDNLDLTNIAARLRSKIDLIRGWLTAILTEQMPNGIVLFPARERAKAGDLLAKFGDDRPGVGLCSDGTPWLEWRNIDAGTFLMGSDPQRDPYFKIPYPNPEYAENFKQWIQRELPQHPVTLPAFRISRYPITNAQFQAFIDDGGYREEKYWTETGCWKIKEKEGWNGIRRFQDERFALPNHPAVGVSWYEAMAFCAWLTEKNTPPLAPPQQGGVMSPSPSERGTGGEVIRLPTEAEWEYAARGTDGRLFAFSDEIASELANYGDTNLGVTSAVGCFPRGRSAFGCDDMTGNVWEWCLNQYYDYADGEPSGVDIQKSLREEKAKVLRGGAWGNPPHDSRCAFRDGYAPDDRNYGLIGFRVVLVSRTL